MKEVPEFLVEEILSDSDGSDEEEVIGVNIGYPYWKYLEMKSL